MKKKYKILVCGVGSIGERHIKNLIKLGIEPENILLFRTRNLPLRNIQYNFKIFNSLKDALSHKPNIALITNPTSSHVNTAIECAKSGCDLFIEKPLSNSFENINELLNIVKEKNLIVMIGYMMRFHPLLLKMKKFIDDGEIGKPIFSISRWSEYLPLWHPWEDYKQSYAARKDLGGGPALTLSHEIDILIWFFGEPIEVKLIKNYDNSLNIETESSVDIICKFKKEISGNIHLDYILNPPKRYFEVTGTKGSAIFDYYNNSLLIISKDKEKRFSLKAFDRNQMFIAEMKSFLNCINKRKKCEIDIEEALKTMKVIIQNRGKYE